MFEVLQPLVDERPVSVRFEHRGEGQYLVRVNPSLLPDEDESLPHVQGKILGFELSGPAEALARELPLELKRYVSSHTAFRSSLNMVIQGHSEILEQVKASLGKKKTGIHEIPKAESVAKPAAADQIPATETAAETAPKAGGSPVVTMTPKVQEVMDRVKPNAEHKPVRANGKKKAAAAAAAQVPPAPVSEPESEVPVPGAGIENPEEPVNGLPRVEADPDFQFDESIF